jgi:transcriptional accessory protein Tex/SPT6
MGKGYVRHPSEVVKEGEEIDVMVQKVNRRKRQIDLTLNMQQEQVMEALEDEEPFLSPMEIAFREAQKSNKGRSRQQRGRRSRGGSDHDDIEDIYRRTLERR